MNRPPLLALGALLVYSTPLTAAGTPPAQVSGAVKESELTTVTLTPEAEKRLGIRTVATEKREVPRTLTFSGETVVSLAAGSGDAASAPVLGGSLDERFRIADAQAGANGQVEQARVQVEATRLALRRAESMLKTESGSARAVEEARAQAGIAEAALETAAARRALLGQAIGEPGFPTTLWVRAQVYAGQINAIDPKASAVIRTLSSAPDAPGITATPVAGPRTASPLSATVDLYYKLDATLPGLRAGERVSATLSARASEERLVVPWSAILYDIYGGQWVYENTAPQTFVRRRVQLERVAGADAILARGPKPGSPIVTDGAAELFGTEFGAGH